MLLGFKNERTDNDAIGDYQAAQWGTAKGETVVAELSALAANSLATERDRETFRRERAEHIRERLLEHQPKFVIMYGLGARFWYQRIAGSAFDADGYALGGKTLCSLVAHPVARPTLSPIWWSEKGHEIRELVEARKY